MDIDHKEPLGALSALAIIRLDLAPRPGRDFSPARLLTTSTTSYRACRARAPWLAGPATITDAAETAAIIEADLEQLRRLGGRLRARPAPREARRPRASRTPGAIRIVEVGEGAEGDLQPAQIQAASICRAERRRNGHGADDGDCRPAEDAMVVLSRRRGQLVVHAPASPDPTVIVEIADLTRGSLARLAGPASTSCSAPPCRAARGDARRAGLIADAIGGAIYIASDRNRSWSRSTSWPARRRSNSRGGRWRGAVPPGPPAAAPRRGILAPARSGARARPRPARASRPPADHLHAEIVGEEHDRLDDPQTAGAHGPCD